MSDDLFFIPMIARALQETDPRAAMIDAFERIHAMGGEPRYQRGYQQFIALMNTVLTARLEGAPEEIGALILEELDRPISAEIIVELDDVAVASFSFPGGVGVHVLSGSEPGNYRLKLDAGRVLWEGHLSEKDLVWAEAYPREPLSLAADTDGARQRLTRELELLDGTLAIRVYPGVEAGSVEIELKAARSPR